MEGNLRTVQPEGRRRKVNLQVAANFSSLRNGDGPPFPPRSPELRLPLRPDFGCETLGLADHSRQSVWSEPISRPRAENARKNLRARPERSTPHSGFRSPLSPGGRQRGTTTRPWPAGLLHQLEAADGPRHFPATCPTSSQSDQPFLRKANTSNRQLESWPKAFCTDGHFCPACRAWPSLFVTRSLEN